MTIAEFKRWLTDRLATIEPRIGEPPSAEWAAVVAEAKQHCYALGFHDFALSLPDSEKVKTPLTACNQLRRCLSFLECPEPARDTPSDGLLDINEAAAYLGYNPAGLRKLCKQQRIQFLQNGRGPFRFRREWLDEFIAANASGPEDIERSPAQRRTPPPPISVEPQLGFDPSFFYADSHNGCE